MRRVGPAFQLYANCTVGSRLWIFCGAAPRPDAQKMTGDAIGARRTRAAKHRPDTACSLPSTKVNDVPTLKQTCLGWKQEAFNGITMLPTMVLLLLRIHQPAILYFAAVVCIQTVASMSFHLVLMLSMLPSASAWRPPAHRARTLMDVDMMLSHAVHLSTGYTVFSMAHPSRMTLEFASVACLNLAGIAAIAFSSSSSKAELDRELVTIRYPLMGAAVYLETWQRYIGGATHDAYGMAVTITLLCSFVLADRRLGGWGHGIGHLWLWIGTHYRANALVFCSAAGAPSADNFLSVND